MRTLLALLLPVALAFAGEDEAFANDLFARLAAKEGNVVCSPLSVRVALAMAYGGARGTTKGEMAKALRLGQGPPASLAALVQDYDGKERGKVAMPALADAAWVGEGATLLPAYVELVKTYGAPFETLDFGKPEAAAGRINGWVSDRTHERIQEIVSPEMLNANTTLVLTNALHFKACWAHRFRARITRDQPFTLASGEKVHVPLMAQTSGFPYAEKGGVRAVELPYEGGRFSMVVILGDDGVPAAIPDGLLDALAPEEVTVFLPRFTFESAFRLDKTLGEMGMPTAFTPKADFSGIDGGRDLYISVVAHKAFVAVDEDGTEAAAATAVALELKGEPGEAKVFRADRPFLFLIRDRETKATLFLGRLSDPR
jgi:serpin B